MTPSNLHSRGFTLVELMIAVAVIGILAVVAFPQYQVYVYKAQVQRVVAEAASLKPAVEACILSGKTAVGNPATFGNCDPQALGSTLQATAGNSAPSIEVNWTASGTGVPQVNLSSTDPSTIVATFGNLAGTPLKTSPLGTVTWTRQINGSWSCRMANVDPKFVSAACPL